MSTGLAPGVAPGALVPGDPAGPRALAQRLDAYADSAATAAAQLRSLDAGDWVGEAAEAFRQTLGEMPQQLERAVGAFAEAASALRGYASVLAEAQQRAGLAQARVERAEADTAVWRRRWTAHEAERAAEAAGGPPAGPAPPTHDPGAAGRASAEALLEAARAEVEAAARAAAARMERAAAEAPDEPGFWASAWHAAGQFVAGAAEATVDLAEFAFKLTTVYAMVDPEGYVDNLVGLGQGIAYGVTHPVEFARAVTNWDMWLENPARALGQLVPDLVLALGTAGTGTAATAAARVGRSADRLDGLADGARTADRAAEAGDAVRRSEVGSIRNVNPGYPGPGRTHNCANCAVASDATLRGRPASAMPGKPTSPQVLERLYGRRFEPVSSPQHIESILLNRGPGATGIVMGTRTGGIGHVFNAVNQRGTVRFLDGQIGGPASFDGFDSLYFLPTR